MNRARGVLLRRLLATLVVAGPLVALAGPATWAALAPTPPNPHGGFKGECAMCHDARGWKPARVSAKFDHGRYGFELAGAHATASCTSCHASLDFRQANTRCASCHEDPHRGEMGVACARCHSARSFVDRAPMVRAHLETRFPLTGSHASLDCEACHPATAQGRSRFVGTRAECRTCHEADYRAVREPDHAAGGFPMTCESCHGTLSWSTARFNHDRSGFPLTGAHRAAACAQCHGDGVYRGKSTACASCHRSDYDATAAPAHRASGFGLECQACHGTAAWTPANLDHSLTGFPLTGAHRATACAQCHGDGVYDGKPTDCASCHRGDYDATTDPSHAGAGFPVTCESCHSTTAWSPSSWDHDAQFFPIHSGTHAGRWSRCSDCHTNPSNYHEFTCLACHPHSDQAETDGHHAGEPGYAYNSASCYSCHPRGTH